MLVEGGDVLIKIDCRILFLICMSVYLILAIPFHVLATESTDKSQENPLIASEDDSQIGHPSTNDATSEQNSDPVSLPEEQTQAEETNVIEDSTELEDPITNTVPDLPNEAIEPNKSNENRPASDEKVEKIDEVTPTIETPPKKTQKSAKPETSIVQPAALADVSLLKNPILNGSFSNNKTVNLEFTASGAVNITLNPKQYAIFKIPDALFSYIDLNSLNGTYSVPTLSLLGIVIEKKGTIDASNWIIDQNRKEIIFETSNLLSVNILSSSVYKFTLQFNLNRLPLGSPQQHQFVASYTNSIVDIGVLSSDTAKWTLDIPETSSPMFFLEVPDTISFGTLGINTDMQNIYRTSNMKLRISHQNAIGYPYQLTARASPLSSPTQVLNDAVYFKHKNGNIVLLNSQAQLISSGLMTSSPIELIYTPQEGLFLDLNGQTPKPGTFATTIEWTLIDSL